MWIAGTSASSSISLLTEIRNIGPACGEAGAPTMVLTSVTRPAAGARSESAPVRLAGALLRRRRQPRQFLIVGDHVAFADQDLGDLGAFLVDADHRFAARHDEAGDPHHVGEAGVGGLGDDDQGAARAVSFSSGRGRCSNQYHQRPATARRHSDARSLRYSESFIAGSIQTLVMGGSRVKTLDSAFASGVQFPANSKCRTLTSTFRRKCARRQSTQRRDDRKRAKRPARSGTRDRYALNAS